MMVFTQRPLSRSSVGALVVILSVAGEGGGRAERASQELEAIRQFYLAIHSVHLKARAEISRTEALESRGALASEPGPSSTGRSETASVEIHEPAPSSV